MKSPSATPSGKQYAFNRCWQNVSCLQTGNIQFEWSEGENIIDCLSVVFDSELTKSVTVDLALNQMRETLNEMETTSRCICLVSKAVVSACTTVQIVCNRLSNISLSSIDVTPIVDVLQSMQSMLLILSTAGKDAQVILHALTVCCETEVTWAAVNVCSRVDL